MSQNAEKILQYRSYPDTAEVLFLKRGVIDKETFDCYFRSKDALMNSVVAGVIKADQEAALKAASDIKAPVLEKFFRVLMAQRPTEGGYKEQLILHLHQSDNAEFHQKSLVGTIESLSPILAGVVEEGIEEGVFHTPYPREIMDFLLTASSMIFDEDLFGWNEEEITKRAAAFVHMMEVCLGSGEGSFEFIYGLLTGKEGCNAE